MHIIRGSQCTPEQLRAIATVLVAENGREYPEWTVAQAAAETALPGPIPITFVAVEGDAVLGCASLLDDDEVSGWDDHIWLGNVVVEERARGRGIGASLVDAVEAHAASLAISELHLVTSSATGWYLPKGWTAVGDADVHGHPMTVMHKTLI